jgi:3',5'-cyclic AMP phosphodiesterase CpdA
MRRALVLISALLVVLVAFAACENEEKVPPPSADRGVADPTFSFLAIGDFGERGDAEEELSEAVHAVAERRGVDALVSVGDNAYPYANRDLLRMAWDSYEWVEEMGLPFYPVLGNHDVKDDDGKSTMEFFDMPGRYYTEHLGDADLFLLDATIAADPDQLTWLEGAFRDSQATWRIVVLHYPPFSCSRSAQSETLDLLPVFEANGVDLVLTGHEHNYQRFELNGVGYVIDGGGGAALYDVGICPPGTPPLLAANDSTNSYVAIQGNTRVLELQTFGLDGSVIDELRLRR